MPQREGQNAHKTVCSLVNHDKISVIIVTLNAEATLQSCLNSIYRQAYNNLEVIVMDGKSSDGTTDILRQNYGKVTYWQSEPDNGIYDAMNKGTKHATGKWIYFLGADDILLPDFSQFANELSDPNAIYYGSVRTRGVMRFGKVSTYHMAKTGIFHQAIVYPADVFKKYSYNLKYRIFADYELNMRCFKDKSFKWIYKDHVIANFNHTGLSGTQRDDAFENDKSNLIYENFGKGIWLRFAIKQLKAQLKQKIKA
jgi:glycosyltransferase involved in cell wall biosynthesis